MKGNRQIVIYKNKFSNIQLKNRKIDGLLEVWIYGLMEGWMVEWMYVWIDRLIDRYKYIYRQVDKYIDKNLNA